MPPLISNVAAVLALFAEPTKIRWATLIVPPEWVNVPVEDAPSPTRNVPPIVQSPEVFVAVAVPEDTFGARKSPVKVKSPPNAYDPAFTYTWL